MALYSWAILYALIDLIPHASFSYHGNQGQVAYSITNLATSPICCGMP